MELKVQDDGLSTNWIVNKSIYPIYSGGKVSQNTSDVIGALNNGNVSLLTLNNHGDSNNVNLNINSLFKEDEYQDEVLCFCMNPHIDHRHEIVLALRNNLITHWDYINKKRLLAIKGHNMPVLCMEFHSSGLFVATGSADRTVRVWDLTRGHCTHIYRHKHRVRRCH